MNIEEIVVSPGVLNTTMHVSMLHTAFACAASTASGAKVALVAQGETETTVMAWAGDGATFDIGFQALSAAVERNDRVASEVMGEENITTILKHPATAAATDGATHDGVIAADDPTSCAPPRNPGSYPKALRRYVREMKVLRLLRPGMRLPWASPASWSMAGWPSKKESTSGHWSFRAAANVRLGRRGDV
jgi:hypothetical protein